MLPSLPDVLAVSPSDSRVLYAGVDGLGMYKSSDGGRTWYAVNAGLNVPPGARFVVTAITLDPADPQRVVIATGVMLGTSSVRLYPGGLYSLLDGGASWTLLRQPTSDEPLTFMAIKGSQLYARAGDQIVVYPYS